MKRTKTVTCNICGKPMQVPFNAQPMKIFGWQHIGMCAYGDREPTRPPKCVTLMPPSVTDSPP